MKIDRAEAKRRARALIAIGWHAHEESLADAIEQAVRDTAEECARTIRDAFGVAELEH